MTNREDCTSLQLFLSAVPTPDGQRLRFSVNVLNHPEAERLHGRVVYGLIAVRIHGRVVYFSPGPQMDMLEDSEPTANGKQSVEFMIECPLQGQLYVTDLHESINADMMSIVRVEFLQEPSQPEGQKTYGPFPFLLAACDGKKKLQLPDQGATLILDEASGSNETYIALIQGNENNSIETVGARRVIGDIYSLRQSDTEPIEVTVRVPYQPNGQDPDLYIYPFTIVEEADVIDNIRAALCGGWQRLQTERRQEEGRWYAASRIALQSARQAVLIALMAEK